MIPFATAKKCPKCETPMHEMSGAHPQKLDIPGEEDDDIIIMTCCKECGVLLEYNANKDALTVMRQEVIDYLPESEFKDALLVSSMIYKRLHDLK